MDNTPDSTVTSTRALAEEAEKGFEPGVDYYRESDGEAHGLDRNRPGDNVVAPGSTLGGS